MRSDFTTGNKKYLSAVPCGQEVGPYVQGLIGQLEEAEDAVGG